MSADEKYMKLKALHDSALLLKEGGNPVVLLPDFPFRSRGKSMKMDLLLHPSQHSGYLTRLFFQSQIPEVGQNWTGHRVVERQWWAPSWQSVQANMPWPAMLCAHLRAVA